MNNILARMLPFIGIGIFLVIIIIALIFLSYIFVIGGIIGLVLFAVAYIKARFFPKKTEVVVVDKKKTYEHKE